MTTPYQKYLENHCVAFIPGDLSNSEYGYVPSLAAAIIFCVLFGLSTIGHIVQSVWTRYWWCSVFAVGALTELIGWAGRAWSSKCPYELNPFLMQITTLILAPTFFTAGIYVLLGRFIELLGRSSSMMSPRLYLYIFVTCDIVSLVVQAIGGGMAATALQKGTNTATGTQIMVAGIVFQMASISVFVFFAADFFRRIRRFRLLDSVKGSIMPLLLTMAFAIALIYARSIYRTIELLQGWTGYLITHEVYFIALDGSMMAPAVIVFNIIHPAWFMPTMKYVGEQEYNECDMAET